MNDTRLSDPATHQAGFGRPSPFPSATAAPGESSGGFALEAALERCDGDQDLLEDMIDLLLLHAPRQLAGMRGAIAASDPVGVARFAHSLRGSISNLGGARIGAALLWVEDGARAGEAIDSSSLFEHIHVAWEQLAAELSAWKERRAR